MDKVRKVYVDSRFRTKDSVSNSDFKVELKEAIDLPENTVCYVDDISILLILGYSVLLNLI